MKHFCSKVRVGIRGEEEEWRQMDTDQEKEGTPPNKRKKDGSEMRAKPTVRIGNL